MKYRFLSIVLFLSLMIGIATVAGASPLQQENAEAAPRVVESIPFEGEELLLDQEIIIYFDQPMDRASVESAFLVEPDVALAPFEWQNDYGLIVRPAESWERNTAYTFTIGTEAKTTAGTPIEEPQSLTFNTIGFLEVIEVLPESGQREVAGDTPITVIFNRPVVPLVTIEEQADLPDPIVFDPPITGEGEWLNTSIYIFRPDPGLPGGMTITATIPDGLSTATGAILQADYQWTFSTLEPQVIDVFPYEGEPLPLEVEFSVSFSQPMNAETAQQAISLTPNGGVPVPLGEFEWNADNTYVTFENAERLILDTDYTLFVDRTIATSVSGANLDESWTEYYRTVPYPAIVSTSPSDGTTGAPPYGGFDIYFNAPIDQATLEEKVIIEPEPWREYDSYYYDYDNRYSLFFDTEPSTEYTITILPGIADPYGNTINETLVVHYSTGRYDPEINLNTPGYVGLYSAYNPTTRLFATHRNVSRLDLELYRLDMTTLANLIGYDSWNFRDSWSPSRRDLLREWTINVQSQLNKRRYELLLLTEAQVGSGIQNIECLGAPATQIMLGATAQVTETDPRPLRVRSDPNLAGEILTELPVGTTFTIIDGPICADGYIWWKISSGGDVEGWSAEGSTTNYFMEMIEQPTSQVVTEEDLNPEDNPGLPPGIYYMEMSAPETAAMNYSPIEHVALVATANITLKLTPDQVFAWVTDLQTGEPVASAPVTFYDGRFNEIGRMNTNEDGIALLEIPRQPDLYRTFYATLVEGQQFGFGTTDWDYGLDPWNFDVPGDFQPEEWRAYLYTDRPIYRPDQPVYFRGIVRGMDDVDYYIPRNLQTVPVMVYDPEDQIVYEGDLSLTPYGSFADSFELAPEAALGYYRIVVELPNSHPDEGDYPRIFSVGFGVAEYQAPEFQVEVNPAEAEVVQGDEVEVLVESAYFFGGAVSNADVTWSVLSADYFFNYTGDGYYSFVDYNYDEGPGEYYDEYGEVITEGEGTTDDQGNFIIRVPADLGTRTQSQLYTVEARVTDESDQQVAGRAQVVVHQGLVYVGLRPEHYISRAETETQVNVITVGWDSEPVASQEVEYRVVERRWSSVQEEDELGRTVWTWEVEELPITDGTVTTNEEGEAQILFTPPIAGSYKVYATVRDEFGNEVTSSTFMWVTGSNYVSWRQQNSNRFDVITDADSYEVGDTAEILIASPFQGPARALITVERGGIVSYEVVDMTTNSYVYELPITLDHAPNIYVSVLIVKGVDEATPYAEFRMGMAQLIVSTERLAMNVEVTPDLDVAAGEFAGPGDEVTYTIRTTDWEGNPVQAEVGVSLTDLSVLTIASPNSSPLMEYFYSERGVSVRTSTPLTVSVDKVTQTIIDTVKGGGGGGADQGIFDVREEFVDTPGWEPSLVTDENGEGTFTVTLPDNLTTWRLDARAVTDGEGSPMLVGQTTFDILSTKPLLLRPQTPRFMIVNDVVNFAAVVNNNTGESQTVEVTLEGTGFELAEGQSLTQTVEIPASGRTRVDWTVTVLDVSSVDLTFYASGNGGEYTDASKPPLGQGDARLLPVYKYEVPETVGTAGSLYDGGSRTEIITLPRRFDVTQGELTINIDRSLAAATIDGLNYLQNYPYQCTEQTISRFLPNVITARAMSQLNLDLPEIAGHLDSAVNFAIQRLYAQQHTDGGWGWFPESRSNPLVTAYALIGLVEARNSGYSIEQRVIDRAADYVEQEVRSFPSRPERWQINRQTFMVYALTHSGYPQPSAASRLYDDYRLNMNLDAKAYLTLAMFEMNGTDPRLANLLTDFMSSAILSATGAHFEDEWDRYNWTTNTRTTALVLKVFVQLDPENQLIPQIVRWLMVARTADAWETTQETAWAVMALTDWMVVSGELNPDYQFTVGLNGVELTLPDNIATRENVTESEELRIEVALLLADEANRVTFARTEGDGNLYYTAHLEAYLPVPEVEAVSRGIIIDRKYYAFRDESRTPITGGHVGDQVEVVVTIIAPAALHYVIIEDPIPAGSAAVDPNLLTSSVVTQRPELDRTDPLMYGWGWWWFSRTEFRDEKVVMYADYLPAGTYEFRYTIRLGLPGEFNVIPPTGQEFYFPEVYGRGNGSLFTIEPALEEEAAATEPETVSTEAP